MEIEGTIILDLPKQEGVSKAGNTWKKKEWVLETGGTYPKKVKFHVFGEKADTFNFEVGKRYIISYDIESREFNGRWYTDISCYSMREPDGTVAAPAATQTAPAPAPSFGQPAAPAADPFAGTSSDTDDLPF